MDYFCGHAQQGGWSLTFHTLLPMVSCYVLVKTRFSDAQVREEVVLLVNRQLKYPAPTEIPAGERVTPRWVFLRHPAVAEGGPPASLGTPGARQERSIAPHPALLRQHLR